VAAPGPLPSVRSSDTAAVPPAAPVADAGASAAESEHASSLHFGADAAIGAGVLFYCSLAARLENEVKPGGRLMARAGYAFAVLPDADGFKAGFANVGYRSYSASGTSYAGIEGGLIVAEDLESGRRRVVPDAIASVGVKAGPLDLGLSASLPMVALGLSVGVDFSSAPASSSPRQAEQPRGARLGWSR
jgi:hypothetical protein